MRFSNIASLAAFASTALGVTIGTSPDGTRFVGDLAFVTRRYDRPDGSEGGVLLLEVQPPACRRVDRKQDTCGSVQFAPLDHQDNRALVSDCAFIIEYLRQVDGVSCLVKDEYLDLDFNDRSVDPALLPLIVHDTCAFGVTWFHGTNTGNEVEFGDTDIADLLRDAINEHKFPDVNGRDRVAVFGYLSCDKGQATMGIWGF